MLVKFEYPQGIDTLVENFFNTDRMPVFLKYPAIDVFERDNETVVAAELPGVKKEDVRITFQERILTISGDRKSAEIPEDARVLLNEVNGTKFNRSVEIGHDVDVDKITAEMKEGILKIVLPKSESAKVRTIELK
jgi:HSP20 family protein